MKPESSRFSQQAINKIAEIAIASQLKQEVDISVNIVTTLNQLTKGQIDAIVILIRGLVLSQCLRTEEFQLDIGAVTVKPMSAMRGKIKLVHPSQGKLRVVIHQDDLTIALNERMQQSPAAQTESSQAIPVPRLHCIFADGAITVQSHPLNLSVNRSPDLSPGQFANSFSDSESIVLTAVTSSEQPINWRSSLSADQLSSPFISDLLNHLDRLLSLKDFEQKGLSLKVQDVQIADSKLTIAANAFIQEFPPD